MKPTIEHLKNRKGAVRIADISTEVIDALNQGLIETVNLMEGLAIDNEKLISNVLHAFDRDHYTPIVLDELHLLPQKTITKVNLCIGLSLLKLIKANNDKFLLNKFQNHPSDIVRGWACYLIGYDHALLIDQKCDKIRPFATDPHFGVREFAWMAMRESVSQELEKSIQLLRGWVHSEHEFERRYASELTRPRGVWCAHLEILKARPELARDIIEPLHNDQSKYVQNSVANWLNDASKTKPDWVQKICNAWSAKSNSKATEYIVKRALRTIEKKNSEQLTFFSKQP